MKLKYGRLGLTDDNLNLQEPGPHCALIPEIVCSRYRTLPQSKTIRALGGEGRGTREQVQTRTVRYSTLHLNTSISELALPSILSSMLCLLFSPSVMFSQSDILNIPPSERTVQTDYHSPRCPYNNTCHKYSAFMPK